ncbi:hypothetical protein JAAARDRAFT_39173 [Jaapia argillacea MUCL 33604]|uniref:Amino acid transporter transmembrane domain-containing protein n=1 Tax=Jaapia argillacea MUCL 33604 TaxID=933084 RepID=A0A067PFF5_9AGAM|nr:hypothetical protein JAAARDRAFT_39173 [Jaapia argillacea MUCL 33604]
MGRHSREQAEAHRPLLDSETIFAVDDDDDEDEVNGLHEEASALDRAITPPPREHLHKGANGRSVRFQEDVQVMVIPPSLRSTTQSREAEFDLDEDELDDTALAQLSLPQPLSSPSPFPPSRPSHPSRPSRSSRSSRRRDHPTPLLVGLLDSSTSRLTPSSIPLPSPASGPFSTTNGIPEGQSTGTQIDLEELAAKRDGGGGLLNSIANMSNSILGAGIIGLPYALRLSTLPLGIILLISIGLVTDWTIRLIVVNAKLSGRKSYVDVMGFCWGASGRAAVSGFQFGFAFGGMCAFGIIIGDTIPHVLLSLFPSLPTIPLLSLLSKRQPIIALCTLCISYPLSLYRDIHKLSVASSFALGGMGMIIGAILVQEGRMGGGGGDWSSGGAGASGGMVGGGGRGPGNPNARWDPLLPSISGLARSIGVISFAFVCHHNTLLIYNSLHVPTLDRFRKVTHCSVALSVVACLVLGVSGFWVFTDKTEGNVLNNFGPNDALINVARFCFGMNMFTTLPLELFVCREVIEQYFFSHEPFNYQRHVLFTTSIIFSAMFISLITCDLGVMLEITGGVSATALAFIFPAACYLKLTYQNGLKTKPISTLLTRPPRDHPDSQLLSQDEDAQPLTQSPPQYQDEDEDDEDDEGEEEEIGYTAQPLPLSPHSQTFLHSLIPPSLQYRDWPWEREDWPWWLTRGKFPAVACVVFGVCVMGISLVLALGKAWTSEGDARICV